MLRSLRSRLVLSHILPVVIAIPMMSLALSYLLETRFLLPKLAQDLLDDARLLYQITQIEYPLYGNQSSVQQVLLRLELNPQVRLVYLAPDGSILYSNDPDYLQRVGEKLELAALKQAQQGQDVVLTDYSLLSGSRYTIQVLMPVTLQDRQPVGILWLTYYEASLTQLFQQIRLLSILAVLGSLFVGASLGSLLAYSLSKPIHQATEAIRGLTSGEHSQVLVEQGPEEIRALIREVNVLVTRLNSLEQARRQLLANLVHELGRPLGALRSAIQALARGAAEDPQLLHELTSGMDEETARLQGILNDLADLHERVLGSLELKKEPVSLTEWLPRTLLPWQEAAIEKHLDWQLDLSEELPEVLIDQVRFSQVIGNLASNAVKFTPAGGSIHISAGKKDDQVWISIRDTGPGIPLSEQKQIFQPFYQGIQGKRSHQGMGLGLSIANDLINAHGGHITLESQPGQGSTFTVWLPIAPPSR